MRYGRRSVSRRKLWLTPRQPATRAATMVILAAAALAEPYD
jgi:hypothetical protein